MRLDGEHVTRRVYHLRSVTLRATYGKKVEPQSRDIKYDLKSAVCIYRISIQQYLYEKQQFVVISVTALL